MTQKGRSRGAAAPRFAVERQEAIAQLLQRQPSVAVAALSQQFGVSEDSIRRDLQALAARGLAHKTHGGAVAPRANALPVRERLEVHGEAKAAIAARAAALVQPHQSVFIGTGSTALRFAELLARPEAPRPLTVITAALDVAHALADAAPLRLVLAGGAWNAQTRAFDGEATVVQLRTHRADWAFVGACAVHARAGVTDADAGDAATARAMLDGAVKSVLLADRSKFGTVEPYVVAEARVFTHLVTDVGAGEGRKTGFGSVLGVESVRN
jgi:DeoR/GlpR family transcriptional regulator of sugar metabolism